MLLCWIKNNRLIYKCKECKEEWKRPLNKLFGKSSSIYQFCEDDLNRFVLPLPKGVSQLSILFLMNNMDSWENFDETALLSKEAFYSNLNLENISDEVYAHAQKVWDVFKIKNLGEYHDLYVKIDTLLMSDILENFRNMCLDVYELDPAYLHLLLD